MRGRVWWEASHGEGACVVGGERVIFVQNGDVEPIVH